MRTSNPGGPAPLRPAAPLRAAGIAASALAHAGLGWMLWTGAVASSPPVPLSLAVRFVATADAAPPPANAAAKDRVVEPRASMPEPAPAEPPPIEPPRAEPAEPLRAERPPAAPPRAEPPRAAPIRKAEVPAARRHPPRKSHPTRLAAVQPAQRDRKPPNAEPSRVEPPAVQPPTVEPPTVQRPAAEPPAAAPTATAPPAAQRAAAEPAASTRADTRDVSPTADKEADQPVARSDTRLAHAAQSAIVPPSSAAAYLRNPAPVYPSMSRRLGEQGRVVLRVFVERDGRPSQVSIGTSSGSTRLDSAALDAVRGWTFVPAMRGEERVSAWVLVPVQFRLDQG